MAAKLMENPDISLCAEVVREFLEFYRMDYTLQVFLPECNLPPGDKVRDRLESKLPVKKTAEGGANMPILMQVLQMLQAPQQQPGSASPPKELPSAAIESAQRSSDVTPGVPANNMATTKYDGFPMDDVPLSSNKKEEPKKFEPSPVAAEVQKPKPTESPKQQDLFATKPKAAVATPVPAAVPEVQKKQDLLAQPLPPLPMSTAGFSLICG